MFVRPSVSKFARYGGAVLIVAVAISYFAWRPLKVSGSPMGDFAAYYAGGSIWLHGGDPYGSDVWNVERTLPGIQPQRKELLPYVGPPLGLPIWAGLSLLPYSLATAAWGIVLALCIVVVTGIPARLAGRRLRGADVVTLVLFCAACGPIIDGLTLGQAALPAAAALDVAILCAARGRWLGAAAGAFFAVSLKPNLALVLLATVRSAAAVIAYGVAAAITLLGNVVVMHGPRGLLDYLAILPQQTESERFYAYQFTPTAIAFGLGLGRHLSIELGTLVAVAAILAVAAAIAYARASLVDGAAIACAGFPFVVPYVHTVDFVLALLPGLLVIFRARGATWLLGAFGLVLVSLSIFALAQGQAGLIFALVMSVVIPLEIAALCPTIPWKLRLSPLLAVPFVLALGLMAPPERIPMWPAALPRHFEAAPGAPANATWRRELVASGLETERPWASLLRIVTLGGTLLVGIAMTISARRTPGAPNLLNLPVMPLKEGEAEPADLDRLRTFRRSEESRAAPESRREAQSA
jgi:hypothetical protein